MCASARDVLLRWYVEQSAQSIGFMIRKSLTAIGPRLANLETFVRSPITSPIGYPSSSASARNLDVGDAAEDAAEDDDGRVGDANLRRAVVEPAVKSHAERPCQTFPTKFAFQQIALDVRYFAEHALAPFMPVAQFTSDGRERAYRRRSA